MLKYKSLVKKAYNLLNFFIEIKYFAQKKKKNYSHFGRFPYFGNFY